jgi:hypothetical protein
MPTRPRLARPCIHGLLSLSILCSLTVLRAQQPDVQTIIQKSVAATDEDFKCAPQFNYKERDRTGDGTKTYQVTMIDGTPYQRLIAINGKPLSPQQEQQEKHKQEQAEKERRAESNQQRQQRIAKFEKERHRDHAMMEQLTRAFTFKLIGQHQVKGFKVYVLRATPRPGYKPPNMETQVLLGMQGELWIDTQTYQWVKVTARVIHPVSIEGFLAQVEPGTQFELERSPVDHDTWQVSHFSMKSQAKVLYLFNHSSSADETYFDYQRTVNPGQSTAQLASK